MLLGSGSALLSACSTATGVGSGSQSSASKGTIKILLWSHFVPRYDTWYDPWAKKWGEQNGVNVVVDHINQADLPARTAAEFAAGAGHDMIEWLTPASAYEPSVHDLTDVVKQARGQVRQPDQLLQAVELQPAHQQVLRLLPHLDARPGRLPEGAVDEGRPAQRPPDLRRSPHRRHGDRPQAARAHGHRHVTRGGLQHGRPGAHLVLWRQHPGRAGEGRPELAGDGRRRRLHGEAVQAGHDRRGVQLDRRLQQPGPGRRPALLHPQLDLRLPDRADDQRERRRRHLLRARAQGADREGHRQPARRPQLHRPQVGGERRQGQEVPAGPGGSGAQLRVQLGAVRLPRLPQHRRGPGIARLAAAAIPSGRSPRTSSRCWPPPSNGRRTSGTRARPTRRKERSSTPISSRP